MPRPGKSKTDWLETALTALEAEGIEGVKIERLAGRLGVARSGFYFHFANRQDLLDQIVSYWTESYTSIVIDDSTISPLPPTQRLLQVMAMIDRHRLTRFDLAMRSWAQQDPHVKQRVEEVYAMRLTYIGGIFGEAGFTGADRDARTRLFVAYCSWAPIMFGEATFADESIRRRQLALMLADPDSNH